MSTHPNLYDTWLEQAKQMITQMAATKPTRKAAKTAVSAADANITRALNHIYARQPSTLPPALHQMQIASLPEDA